MKKHKSVGRFFNYSMIKKLYKKVIEIFNKPPSYTDLRLKLEKQDKLSLLNDQKLVPLHLELNKINEAQNKEWGSFVYCDGYYYQGYKKIGIHGIKPTEERISNYDIDQYLSKEKTVLDIGSNAGFMACFLSEFTKEVDAIELNPYLVKMGSVTKAFLGLKNVNFLEGDFTEYSFPNKYDLVFSLSNHFTIDGNLNVGFETYIEKIFNTMNKNGIMFFESHDINGDDADLNEKFVIASKYFKLEKYKMVRSFFPQDIDKLFAVFVRLDEKNYGPEKNYFDLEVAKNTYKY